MKIVNIDIDTLEGFVQSLADPGMSEDAIETLADFLAETYDSLNCSKLADIVANAREFADIAGLYEFYTEQAPQTDSKRQLINELRKEHGIIVQDTGISLLAIEYQN